MISNSNNNNELAEVIFDSTKRIVRLGVARSAPVVTKAIKVGAKTAMDALYKIAFK